MLTEEQLARFQERLEAEQTHLLDKIKALDDQLAHDDYDYPLDLSDSATQIYNEEDVISEQNRLRAELVRVERALSRIEAGTYGYSEVSGQPIPIERLEALPTATTLVDEPPPK